MKIFASEIENWFQMKNFSNFSINIVLTYKLQESHFNLILNEDVYSV